MLRALFFKSLEIQEERALHQETDGNVLFDNFLVLHSQLLVQMEFFAVKSQHPSSKSHAKYGRSPRNIYE